MGRLLYRMQTANAVSLKKGVVNRALWPHPSAGLAGEARKDAGQQQAMNAQAMNAQALNAQAMNAQALNAQAMNAQALNAQAMNAQALVDECTNKTQWPYPKRGISAKDQSRYERNVESGKPSSTQILDSSTCVTENVSMGHHVYTAMRS